MFQEPDQFKTSFWRAILFKLKIMDVNRKIAAATRNILLFMDKPPCNPENFVVSYSIIKVVF